MFKNKQGFTLIELLVVIAIIGLLSTLSILALNTARARSRDARRVADVKQIQTALEMYYNDAGSYPTNASMTPGARLFTANGTYMSAIPTPPTPTNDGSCPVITGVDNKYTYAVGSGNSTYTIRYCLGAAVNDIVAGQQTASPAGIR